MTTAAREGVNLSRSLRVDGGVAAATHWPVYSPILVLVPACRAWEHCEPLSTPKADILGSCGVEAVLWDGGAHQKGRLVNYYKIALYRV